MKRRCCSHSISSQSRMILINCLWCVCVCVPFLCFCYESALTHTSFSSWWGASCISVSWTLIHNEILLLLSFLCPLSLGFFPSAVIKRAFCLSVLMSVLVITLGERRSSPPVCSWTSVINSAAALRNAAGAPPVTVDAWDVCCLCVSVSVRVCVCVCVCVRVCVW